MESPPKQPIGKRFKEKYKSWYNLDLNRVGSTTKRDICGEMKPRKMIRKTLEIPIKVNKSVNALVDPYEGVDKLKCSYKCNGRNASSVLFIFIALFIVLYSTMIYTLKALRNESITRRITVDGKF